MTLSFIDGWEDVIQVEGWRLPGYAPFARSRPYSILRREVSRYVLEEVSGRSFLIGGHRGSGKTALVSEVLRDLRTMMIQGSTTKGGAAVSRRMRLQRPMIVRLVARGLLTPPPEPKRPLTESKEAQKGKDDDDEKGGDKPSVSPPAEVRDAEAAEVAGALIHITIALYRALAKEVATGFSNHAGAHPQGSEIAAQLQLDLDDAPEAALLRSRWAQIGRLRGGVLWPAGADAVLTDLDAEDQGVREIVAVATAGQAFQVVSGSVEYHITSVESASRTDEAKLSVDVKDLAARLGALLAGTGVFIGAAAAQAGTAPAAGLGLLAWLGGSLALGWSSTRTRNRERSRNHTFLKDKSVQTLDRELPHVIERIREAGLAPIFVLDELDKLDDAPERIGRLIDRLKHIVSDYAFFCFLANRDFFDAVERVVGERAYPSEHTHFSERLLVVYRHQDLFDFVVSRLRTDAAAPEADGLPIATFALVMAIRSKLNFTDLLRELNRHVQPDQTLTLQERALRERSDLRLEAALQLACEEALRPEPIATRFAQDDAFAQLVIDGLYYIPRCWESDWTAPVNISDESLCAHLLSRLADRSEPKGPAQPVGTSGSTSTRPTPKIQPADLELIRDAVARQAELLSSPWRILADALRARPGRDRWRLDEIVPVELGVPLLQPDAGGGPQVYRFRIDRTGRPRRPAATAPVTEAMPDVEPNAPDLAPAPSPPSAEAGSVADAEFLSAFLGLLQQNRVSVDGLVQAGYMPATLTTASVADAHKALSAASASALQVEAGRRTAGLLRQAVADRGSLLASALVALRRFGWASRDRDGALLAISRWMTPFGSGASGTRLPGDDRLLGSFTWEFMNLLSPDLIREFGENLEAVAPVGTELPSEREFHEAWERMRLGLLRWLRQEGSTRFEDFGTVEVMSAVLGRAPGAVLRFDPGALTRREWSEALLASLPVPAPREERSSSSRETTVAVDPEAALPPVMSGDAPLWLAFVAMRALGFDAATLRRLASLHDAEFGHAMADLDRDTVEEIVSGSPTGVEKGLLILVERRGGTILSDEELEERPMIIVAEEDYPRYERALDWLFAAGALEGVVDEF